MSSEEIRNKPYSEWLEEGLEHIFAKDPKSICLMAILPDGQVLSGYYNAEFAEKALFQGCIQQDIMLDTIKFNPDRIRDALDGESDD